MDRQERRGKTKYLVKWKGYTAEENTWEGLENLKNVMEKIEEFEKRRFKKEIQRIRLKKGKEIKLNPQAKKLQEKGIAREIYSEIVIWVVSRTKEGNLNFSYSSCSFLFFSIYFSLFYF